MPAQVQKSGIMAKYGQAIKKSLAENKDAPIETKGFQNMPPGVESGVAELIECGFFQYGKDTQQKRANGSSAVGEWYFRAAGTAITPESVVVNGQICPVQGLQTSIMEPLCDTKNSKGDTVSTADHVKIIRDHLLLLAGGDVQDIEDLEAFAKALKEQSPPIKFRFSTRQGKVSPQYPNPRTFETWHGSRGVDQDSVTDAGGGVEDNSAPANETPADEQESQANPDADGAYAELVEQATAEGADGGPACDKLMELATAKGMSEDDVRNAPDWQTVADFIMNGEPGEAESEPEPEPEPEKPSAPEKGQMCKHKVLDAKGKPVLGKNKKPLVVDVEIKSVNAKAQTCDLLNYDDKKTLYKGVKWDALVWE